MVVMLSMVTQVRAVLKFPELAEYCSEVVDYADKSHSWIDQRRESIVLLSEKELRC